MQTLVRISVLSLLVALVTALPLPAEEGFESLFNGKDLSGWEGNTELWKVEDGAITGTTRGPDHLKYNQFLIWKGSPLADFELRLDFRLEGNNNSGVQYRSKQLKDAGDWVVGGYQADIHSNPPYTGMLYDERGRGIIATRGQQVRVDAKGKKEVQKLDGEVKPLDLSKWHELTIIARGNRLVHKVNGVTAVEITDDQESERELSGVLALQVHRGPAMKAQFKNIRLRRFKSDAPKKDATKKDAPKKDAPKNSPSKKKPAKQAGKGTAEPSWVWLGVDGQPAQRVYFRKEFSVRGSVAAARLLGTCDNVMTVYLDGKKVMSHDDWSSVAYEEVSDSFKKSKGNQPHVLAVVAENAGTDNPAGLLLKLILESGWRDTWAVVTDGSWQATTSEPSGDWLRPGYKATGWTAARAIAPLGGGPWTTINAAALDGAGELKTPTATPIERLKIAKGFDVDLVYSVPKDEQGSWVNMCFDPKGRLIVSDQHGGLYRVTLPVGDKPIQVDKIAVDIGEAQGLLWAFDALYVVVNRGGKYESGLYRVTDTDGDDQLDKLETLRKIGPGGGEHGPHAVLLSPDGKSLYVVCGNQTELPELNASRVPRIWDEDKLLPRPYGRGFMRTTPAPGGFICRTDPDGKEWELMASGFRNEFDAAFNEDGELFSYDADMEWDVNTPWYRPTRINHVVSGAEFGWRNGGGKWPEYYPDSLPAVVDVGPGSPTGVCFGYGARFPAKYQRALFVSDWSYGKLYAVHLEPKGSTYVGSLEEFITGTPLPLTDVVINPRDGAMYFAIGGRRVQSGLYRVTYTGDQSTEKVTAHHPDGEDLRELRRQLESHHLGGNAKTVESAWPHLQHSDRNIRFAARVAIEHRPLDQWQQRALDEPHTDGRLAALLALVRRIPRQDKSSLDVEPPKYPATDAKRHPLQAAVLKSLGELSWGDLNRRQRLEWLRVSSLTLLRTGPPTEATRKQLIARFESLLPSNDMRLDTELLELLVYLQAPSAAAQGVALLRDAPTQEEQIGYAKSLRFLREGWTDELRRQYFDWFVRARGYRGGASFQMFVADIRNTAKSQLDAKQTEMLKELIAKAETPTEGPELGPPRKVVADWKMEQLLPLVQSQLKQRDYSRGRKLFAEARCFACHRFDGQGGAMGPDLTALSGRFNPRDLLESVVDPNKVISDQYAAVTIITLDGKIVTGRIVNLAADSIRVSTDMLNPDAQTSVDRKKIDEILPSKVSMMPAGLLNTLNREEVLDLMAYLLSRGNPEHEYFAKP